MLVKWLHTPILLSYIYIHYIKFFLKSGTIFRIWNYVVVADNEFIYKDEHGGVTLFNADNLTTTTILSNYTFVSITFSQLFYCLYDQTGEVYKTCFH